MSQQNTNDRCPDHPRWYADGCLDCPLDIEYTIEGCTVYLLYREEWE
jgi:hypothetical protein